MDTLSQDIRDIHKRSFSRCTEIWNKCNRPKSAEVISGVLSANLLTPCITRWNSLYDSIKSLLQHKDNLPELCYRLSIPTILADEIEYLEEFLLVMEPTAEAIDYLQGEKSMYFGCFVEFKILSSIDKKMREALFVRFEKYFTIQPDAWDAIIAAVTIPEPLLETAISKTEEDVKQMLNTYVLKYGKIPDAEMRNVPQKPQNSFLDFGDDSNDVNVQSTLSDVGNYLQETILCLAERDATTNCLHKHNAIKNVFLKYNTPLPSSAPVKRLFSFAGIVNRSRRQKLSDTNFEMLVLRKANSV